MELRERFRGALLGACLGDASGSGIESLPHAYLRALNDGRGFEPFLSPPDRWLPATIWAGYEGVFPEWARKVRELNPGDTTDDWQLTVVCAESLISSRGWDIEDCAMRHVEAMHQSDKGWGGTTRSAVIEIRDHKRRPYDLPNNMGRGNRPLMTIAPLGLFISLRTHAREHEAQRTCMAHSFLTHGDPRAGIAAYAAVLVYEAVFRSAITSFQDAVACLESVVPRVRALERQYVRMLPHGADSISDRLARLPDVWHDPDALREMWGTDGDSLITCPFTLGSFFRHPTDGRAALIETLNAGGDTDTNASIVGALVGANAGPSAFPSSWVEYRPEYRASLDLADRLYQVATSF